MATQLEGTEFSGGILKKVRWTHDAMIDVIIANPGISQIELAQMFGFSKQWVSRLMCSNSFLARLALRKDEVVDPMLTATVEERMRGAALLSLEVLEEKLEATRDPKLALRALEITTRAEAYGARARAQAPSQNFVVICPSKVETAKEWAAEYTRVPGGAPE